MNVALIEKIFEKYDIPFLLLDADNYVVYGRIDPSSKADEIKGKKIFELFSVWEDIEESRFVHAIYRDNIYVFIKSTTSVKNRLFIGTQTDELDLLRKKIKELQSLNRELDAIIENSYDGIYITDSKGNTLKTNSAIERITGIPKEYYIGKNVNALIERGILKNSVTNKVVKLKRTVSLVQKNYAGNETLLTGSPVYNEKGEIEKVVTNIRDLSDLMELQMQLRKANELNDKYIKKR